MQTLSAEEIGKSYRGRRVVCDVNFHVKQGEVVGLLGPNGAGKTTSFYIVVGLIPADSGRVLIDGQDITHVPMYLRARNHGISYLPQEPSIFRKLSVEATAHRVARRLRAGTVWVNTFDVSSLATPFGGVKDSGHGRDRSLHALDAYTHLKTTWISL